jgi:hypothetical protein
VARIFELRQQAADMSDLSDRLVSTAGTVADATSAQAMT